MVKNFQETVKIYEQGKKYYDALKSVNNLVRDARKVQQTILMVGDITDIYVTNFQRMMRDDNFTVEELGAIAFGYTKLLEESNDVFIGIHIKTGYKIYIRTIRSSSIPPFPTYLSKIKYGILSIFCSLPKSILNLYEAASVPISDR